MVLGVSVGSIPCNIKGNNSPITAGICKLKAGTTEEKTLKSETCRADWVGSFNKSVDCITMDWKSVLKGSMGAPKSKFPADAYMAEICVSLAIFSIEVAIS